MAFVNKRFFKVFLFTGTFWLFRKTFRKSTFKDVSIKYRWMVRPIFNINNFFNNHFPIKIVERHFVKIQIVENCCRKFIEVRN